ncbi:MAG: MerR family transcriptional regulator [Acidimicrobiales bacterium]
MSQLPREHWSIGEVLNLIQDEFPEVTISKSIPRGQGLIDPERTPSGYRRFYPEDFDRLRWVLIQQRDHYLPLRVILERLDSGEVVFEPGAPFPETGPQQPAWLRRRHRRRPRRLITRSSRQRDRQRERSRDAPTSSQRQRDWCPHGPGSGRRACQHARARCCT